MALTPSPREKSLRKSQYPFNCKVCDEQLLSKVSFQVQEKLAHLAKSSFPTNHVCPQCLSNSKSLFNMSRHLEKRYEAGSRKDYSQPTKKMRMECKSFSRTFASKFNLRRYIDKIHKNITFFKKITKEGFPPLLTLT